MYCWGRVWGERSGGDLRPMRAIVRKLDAAANPKYIFAEPRVGYRMAMGKMSRTEEG